MVVSLDTFARLASAFGERSAVTLINPCGNKVLRLTRPLCAGTALYVYVGSFPSSVFVDGSGGVYMHET